MTIVDAIIVGLAIVMAVSLVRVFRRTRPSGPAHAADLHVTSQRSHRQTATGDPSWVEETTAREVLATLRGDAQDFDEPPLRKHDMFDFDWRLPTVFILPHYTGRGIYAQEDVSAMSEVGWVLHVASPSWAEIDLAPTPKEPDAHSNLVLIGGSRRNAMTRNVLEASQLVRSVDFVRDDRGSSVFIDGEEFHVAATEGDETAQECRDFAIVAKLQNPFYADDRVLVVAGGRGFGTWGAAKFLRKEWRRLLALTAGDPFVAVVEIHLVPEKHHFDHDLKRVVL